MRKKDGAGRRDEGTCVGGGVALDVEEVGKSDVSGGDYVGGEKWMEEVGGTGERGGGVRGDGNDVEIVVRIGNVRTVVPVDGGKTECGRGWSVKEKGKGGVTGKVKGEGGGDGGVGNGERWTDGGREAEVGRTTGDGVDAEKLIDGNVGNEDDGRGEMEGEDGGNRRMDDGTVSENVLVARFSCINRCEHGTTLRKALVFQKAIIA